MDIKTELSETPLICTSCLCVGRRLHSVSDHKLKQYYLDTINEIPLFSIQAVSVRVCWECSALLRKVVAFREQVKDSYRILQTYTAEILKECLLTDVSRAPRLQPHAGEHVDVPPGEHVAVPPGEGGGGSGGRGGESEVVQVQSVFVKDEKTDWAEDIDNIKHETAPSGPSDVDDPPYLSDVSEEMIKLETEVQAIIGNDDKNKQITRQKKPNIGKKKVKNKLNNKICNGEEIVKHMRNKKKTSTKPSKQSKIRTIELTYAEVLAERARRAAAEAYRLARHRCEPCLTGFNCETSLKEHTATKHAPSLGKYSCPICKTVIGSVSTFSAHYKRHSRRYECTACGKRGSDRKLLLQHYSTAHAGVQPEYKCTQCGNVSHSIDSHRYHVSRHSARVPCPQCNKTFSQRAGLMNHRAAVHKYNNKFPCARCDKVFRWKSSLKKHMETHDRKSGAVAAAHCVPCGVSFASVCSYQRHMRSSLKHVTSDQLRFICDDCGRRYANKTKLRDHIEEKHLHKSYQCPTCLKPSKNRVCLEQHVRNVHRGRPHDKMCHHCGKGFPTKVQLECHIRSHTGERPFICEFCPTTFSQQSNLYKHNRQVHLNIKSKRPAASKPPAELVQAASDSQAQFR